MTLTPTAQHVAAADRFDRNVAALGVDLPFPDLDFCTGRDGSSTAKRHGHWLAGCSVPRRAAGVMLRHENWAGRSLCLLVPTHAQQIAATLDRLGPTKALIAVVPSTEDLIDFLACCDFAADLASGRLHIVSDEPSMRAAFARHPGLAVPQQMVRLPDADPAAVTAAIAWAQPVFSSLTHTHAARLAEAKGLAVSDNAPAYVLVARGFRLNADAGRALARVFDESGGPLRSVVFDTDRPAFSADAAAAETIAEAGVIIADRPRPAWAPDRPWVAWLTTPSVPPFDPARPRDALILADAAWRPLARGAGWPDARVAVAGWPADPHPFTPAAPPALLLDLPELDPPTDVADVTGRRLAWEAIRDELGRDPFALGDDPARYVERAPARLKLPADADFPVRQFIAAIVAPAFAVGVARWLADQNVDFTIHGRGWPTDDAALAGRLRGPLEDRAAFRAVLAAVGGLIDPSLPGVGDYAASLGVPVVRPFGRTPQRVLHDVATLRAGRLAASMPQSPLTRATVEALVR